MTPKGQWGIATPHGDWDWEENILERAKPAQPQPSDNDQQREVLLVDLNGRPLVVREPRPVGFRPRSG